MEPQKVIRPRASAGPRSAPDKASSVRSDPKRSHIDGVREGKLYGDGYDPKKFHYVWVGMALQQGGIESYEMMGYRILTLDDGVKVTGRFRTKENQIEMMGHVLMACPKERRDEIEQYGPGGDTGLQHSKRIEQLLVGRGHKGADPTRGLGVRPSQIRVSRKEEDLGAGDDGFDDIENEEA